MSYGIVLSDNPDIHILETLQGMSNIPWIWNCVKYSCSVYTWICAITSDLTTFWIFIHNIVCYWNRCETVCVSEHIGLCYFKFFEIFWYFGILCRWIVLLKERGLERKECWLDIIVCNQLLITIRLLSTHYPWVNWQINSNFVRINAINNH